MSMWSPIIVPRVRRFPARRRVSRGEPSGLILDQPAVFHQPFQLPPRPLDLRGHGGKPGPGHDLLGLYRSRRIRDHLDDVPVRIRQDVRRELPVSAAP